MLLLHYIQGNFTNNKQQQLLQTCNCQEEGNTLTIRERQKIE